MEYKAYYYLKYLRGYSIIHNSAASRGTLTLNDDSIENNIITNLAIRDYKNGLMHCEEEFKRQFNYYLPKKVEDVQS